MSSAPDRGGGSRPCRVAVLGATGRMGRAVIALLAPASDLTLSGALTSPENPNLGRDAGEQAQVARAGVSLSDDPVRALEGADVAIDFSLPEAVAIHLEACRAAGCGLVLGVTGLGAPLERALAAAARVIPIVQAPNMSTGVNLCFRLVALAARALGEDYDVEVLEAHHRHKRDAPSGTALRFGELVAAERGRSLNQLAATERSGARPPGSIGFASLRAGEIVGEHTVVFAGEGERVEITHRADRRETFAAGALRAARWLRGRAPGRYGMIDVLGL